MLHIPPCTLRTSLIIRQTQKLPIVTATWELYTSQGVAASHFAWDTTQHWDFWYFWNQAPRERCATGSLKRRVMRADLLGRAEERPAGGTPPREGPGRPVSPVWPRPHSPGVPDSALCNPSVSWNAPAKGLCVKMILCSPFWKKCFHQDIKLKLGSSTGNVQNQMQIKGLQMQIVLF